MLSKVLKYSPSDTYKFMIQYLFGVHPNPENLLSDGFKIPIPIPNQLNDRYNFLSKLNESNLSKYLINDKYFEK